MEKAQKKAGPTWFAAWFCSLPWGSKAMISGKRSKTQGNSAPRWRIVSGWASGAAVCALALSFLGPSAFAGPRSWGGQHAQVARPAPMRTAPMRQQAARPNPQPNPNGGQRPLGNPAAMRPGVGNPVVMRPGVNGAGRPGQEHLPQWLNQHQNLSPQQQEEELRREPGFNRLAPEQQQRVLDRLRTLDARPPEQRQRILQRNEAFEGLSPGAKRDVRMSAQTLNGMAPDRQRMVRRAFNDLRQLPPEQRGQILNSARFSQSFSPDERHVLGSLLSIEPYEPR